MAEEKNIKSDWIDILIRQAAEYSAPSDELLRLQERFDLLGKKYGIERRKDVDRLVYLKMTGSSPVKDSQILKVRYWRTGRHKPQSREQCIELGRALELDESERIYFIQGYYDGADLIFGAEDAQNPVYQERVSLIRELERQYMANAHPDRLGNYRIPWKTPENYLRHYYYQDALEYMSGARQIKTGTHLSSGNYANEFQKSRLLYGDIPRKTILRHLFIMGAPFLSIDVMNERLTALGYLPLTEGHESRFGERIDLLIIGLLKRYEADCKGDSPEKCMEWLRNSYRMLDQRLVDIGHPELRFLYFKALKVSGE